jgi:hypothetical protein
MGSVELGRYFSVVALVATLLVGGCVEAKQYTPPPPSVPVLRLPRNDAYLESLNAASLRPRFSWDASTGVSNEITYEVQYSTDPMFDSEVASVLVKDTTYRPESALAVSMAPPVGRRYYWRVRACIEAVCSEFSPSRRVNVGRSDKDLNGDGYADVVVGAPSDNQDGAAAGRAYVYFGQAGSMDSVADGIIANGTEQDFLGGSVAMVGDVNGDGFADLAVAANGDDLKGVDSGSVHFYYGGAGRSFDVVADETISGEQAGDRFGHVVSGPGDLNGDGYSDVVISAPENAAGGASSGRVYVYFGTSGSSLSLRRGILQGGNAGAEFGSSLAEVGDVNADGMADFIVNNGPSAGGCFSSLYLGSAGQVFASLEQRFVQMSAGLCELVMTGAGDVNGDGRSDIAAVARSTLSRDDLIGRAYVYVMPERIEGTQDISTTGILVDRAGAETYSVAPVGDVNGDGYDDLSTNNRSDVAVYFGRPDITLPLLLGGLFRPLGVRDIEVAGDVNGDGIGDIVVGCPFGGEPVRLYLGGAGSSFDPMVDTTLSAGLPSSAFGYSVATHLIGGSAAQKRVRKRS